MTSTAIGPVRIPKFLLLFLIILALALLFTLASVAQSKDAGQSEIVVFQPAITRNVSSHALSTVIADLNRDGHPDVVVAETDGKVGVMLANGDGTLLPEVTYATASHFTVSVAVADVNRDGKPDIVAANYGGEPNGDAAVVVLIGNGDGTFQPGVAYDSGWLYDGDAAIADVNGDGKPDIVVVNGDGDGTADVGIFLGNGDGTFQPVTTRDSGVLGPWSLAIADLNGDGSPDLIIAAPSQNNLSVVLGNGNGTFQPPKVYAVNYPSSIAVADLNGDGKLDVVVADDPSNEAGVLLGNGDGTLQPIRSYDSGGDSPNSIAIADVNQDGKPDLIVGNCSNGVFDPECGSDALGQVGVLLGKGDGTFQPPVTFLSGTKWLIALAVADMNGDGWPDIVTASNGSDRVTILLNNAGKPVASKTKLTTSASPSIVGQPVTFTATITSHIGQIPDGDLVTFYDDGTMIGTSSTAKGVGTFTTSALTGKAHTIKATYAGDGTFEPSSGSVQQVVTPYSTTTSLESNPSPSSHGQTVTFTAMVGSAGPNAPTGKVTFKDGTTGIGTATLSGGVAILNKSNLAAGTHSITALYDGDGESGKSTSPALEQVVN